MTDIEAANLARPDYIGFVFAKSKRQVSIEQARQLKAALSPEIQAVGVFVNASIEEIIRIVEKGMIDLIQLHGDEDERYIQALRVHTELPIIKAIRVKNQEVIEQGAQLPVSYLLLDTYSKEMYGGTGHAFNWQMIPKIKQPFFLAGGLQIDNVVEAIQQAKPFCVDVSSGVETNGVKDQQKMIEIVNQVRGAVNEKR